MLGLTSACSAGSALACCGAVVKPWYWKGCWNDAGPWVCESQRPQRTPATHVLEAIRVLNRPKLAGETMRAGLNYLATVAPQKLRWGRATRMVTSLRPPDRR